MSEEYILFTEEETEVFLFRYEHQSEEDYKEACEKAKAESKFRFIIKSDDIDIISEKIRERPTKKYLLYRADNIPVKVEIPIFIGGQTVENHKKEFKV